MFLSEADLRRIFPHANEAVMTSVAAEWNETLGKYGINANRNRLLFFLAETSEETGGWRGMVEGGEFTGTRDTYKGRGLIQLTGRSNYEAVGAKLQQDFPESGLVFDLVNNPQLVAEPPYVLKTAAAYWDLNKLNAICDTGDFLRLSNKINGSTTVPNGWPQRQAELARIGKLFDSFTDTGAVVPESGLPSPILKIGDSGTAVKSLQTMLRSAGYDVGDIDGKFGTMTRMALLAFQADHDLVPTGIADSGTSVALNNPGERPLPDQRVSATIGDLIKLGSRTAVNGKRVNWMGILATVLGGLGVTNSAVVTAANNGVTTAAKATGGATQTPGVPVADTLGSAAQQLQNIVSQPVLNAANLTSVKGQLQTILDSLNGLRQVTLGPLKATDISGALQKLHDLLASQPVSATSAKSANDLINQLIALQDQLSAAQSAAGSTVHSTFNSIFDMLPPDALGALTPVLTTAANTLLPGFGGALVTLGIGVATQVFGNNVLQARLDDHRTASNINKNS